jgi:RHS repeat-associated protein
LYDPYGRTLQSSGTWASTNVYRFSSKEWHSKARLYYYGYRFYDPNLQRWINRDPIGEAGGINLYGFVGNDPVNWIDPLGQGALAVGLGVMAGVGVAILCYVEYTTGEKITEVEATIPEFRSMEISLSRAAQTIEDNLARNSQNCADIYKGTQKIGERSLIGGKLTNAARQLTPGQQQISEFFENAAEFNGRLDAGMHAPPIQSQGALEHDIQNAEFEIKRIQLAIEILRAERVRRQQQK